MRAFELFETFEQESQSGIRNETYLVNKIKRLLRIRAPLTIIFHDHQTEFIVEKVNRIVHTGRQNRPGIKGDVDLVDKSGNHTVLSIKTERGNQWESADSYYGKKATSIIKNLLADGTIVLYDRNKPSIQYNFLQSDPSIVYDIDPVAIRASKAEQEQVIFGDDIKSSGGAVIINTFNNSDFILNRTTLHISVRRIVASLADLDEKIWFLIRRDKTRNPKDFIRGLRVVAVSDSRVGGNLRVGANGKVLSR